MSRKTIALWAMLSRAMGQHIFQALSIKRRSHNNLIWQTRVGKLRKVDKLFPSHVKLVSTNNKPGNLQHGRFLSVVSLTYNSETEGEIARFGRNPVCQCSPPFCFVCLYACLCRLKMKRPEQPDS